MLPIAAASSRNITGHSRVVVRTDREKRSASQANPSLNFRNGQSFSPVGGLSRIAQRAGLSVSELKAESPTEIAMVRANCR